MAQNSTFSKGVVTNIVGEEVTSPKKLILKVIKKGGQEQFKGFKLDSKFFSVNKINKNSLLYSFFDRIFTVS